jgi:hypothetical protein
METNYNCPFCKGHLNIGDNIILIVRDKIDQQGLVFLHTELGNYASQVSSSLSIEKGDAVDFFCPYCHTNIAHHKSGENMVHLHRTGEQGKQTRVFFSRIYGEQSTYHLDDDKVHSYGEQAKQYMDPEWFLK